MTTETITAGQDATISVGSGNNTVNVIGGSQDTITIGNGTDTLTVTGGTADTITAGSGNDTVTVTGGADNTITAGNGNVTVVASGDQGDTITLGKGNDTVDLGADDTLNMGKGSELVVLPPSTPTLAAASITVSEDQTISLAGLGISAGLSAFGFGQENIYGFAAADQLEFTTAQFANFAAVMADATQVGQNTVITDSSSDTITLENVAKSTLAAKNFVFVNGSSSGAVLVTITGLPSDLGGFNGGTYTASTGTWTGTAAQFDALTFNAGEETSAQLTVTATDTTTGYSITKTIALTVTPPTINIAVNGVAQEGQTLTAAVTVSNGDAFSYQWQSSSDGTHWSNIAGAAGMTYLVQEGDETKQLRVKVTLTDDSYSVASAATSAVLDAAPTVTTPIITGTAQEGQTLTASASSGQSDNPVSYAWYSSANPNAVLGTGATYVVQEADENSTIEVKATATNDNGVTATATSAATASVIDNAGISLAVSVVGNGTVQQGQTLVATATITGDADDSTAPITYQWQSSSDGGLTWANVGGAVAGNFANGQPSSFLQLTEANEGQQFRVQASFTNDTGQRVSTTSAPTVPTADITPEITIPFSYAADDFSIVKNVNGTPTQIYNDTFSQAPIASSTILSNGVPTPIVFITQGSTWTESGGKAIASSTGVALNPNVSGSAFDLALLDTNTDPTSTLGLKLATTFTVSSTFDLTAPPTGGYGMELTDGTSTHGVDQLERLIVQRVNGNAVVELIQANLTTNTQTVLASHTLTAAELAGNTQIEFQMSHVANTTAVTGTFELIDNGIVTSTTTFSPTASIFTNGIDWTRVDVGAFTSTGVGLNVAPGASPREGQTLTASASTNDNDATLHYQWQESSNGTLWTNIGTDSSTYVVQESDEGRDLRVIVSTTDPDNGQTASVTSATTGPVKDVAPAPAIPTESGSAIEGQTLTASSVTTGSDEPLSIAYQWQSSSDGSTWSNISAATGSTYVLQETDENQLVRVSETFSDDTGQSVTLSSAASASVTDVFPAPAIPTESGSAIEGQTLTASSVTTGSDEPLSIAYQWQSSSDGSTWNNISAATGSTYVLQETDENQLVRVSETFSDDTGQSVTLSSAASASVTDVFPAPAIPTESGSAIEGQTLTASSVTTGSDEPLGIAYQWQSSSDGSTWSNISAATGSTYVLQETDENQFIRVSETFSDDTGQSVTLSSAASASVEDVFPAPATPTVGGSAIEGQTLTASSVTTGSDEPLSIAYQWQSSSDGSTWSNISGATGSTYVLQETDENQLVRVSETFSDDTGQSVTLSSAASTSVEDVFPAPATPTVGGSAIEGQMLTASSVTTGSDEPLGIAYQWQSSSDGSTWSNISAATGSTYVLQETDENQFVRVSETFSDDTGQSATLSSAATSAVLDNSSLSVSVSVVGNGTVQQGQTLVATATITGDADDSTAAVTYQWQSSSDGGLTWANVAATAGGNFNGVASSFYQLAEGDQGKLFRAQASFTDDTGQPVPTTSVATASVADVTPEITVPFSYAADSLSIVKNGTQIYTNNFSQAPITSPTILSNGSPSPIIFITQGSTWTESGGKAIASSTGAAHNPNVTGGNAVFDVAVLNTNTNQQGTGSGQSDLGLKEDAAFTTTAAFDLTVPTSGTYGTELTDGTSSHGVDQLERLLVANDGHGNAVVELVQANLVANTSTILASQTLTAAQLASNNQIELQFTHAANSTAVTGAFALGNSGTFGAVTAFTPTASIFTNGITWTRVDVGAFTSAGVGITGTAQEGHTLTANAATNDSDATLHYLWQSSANGGATWTPIAGAADSSSYTLQDSDQGNEIRVVASTTDPDNGQTASATSAATAAVTGAPEAPLLGLPTASSFVTLDYPGAGPSGNGTFADGINNAGAIVGGAAIDSQHTTGWEDVNGTFSAVGVPGSQDNNADGINNSGVIAGFNSPVRSTPRYGFVDNSGSYGQINVSPGISTTVNGINDSGVIVGASYLYNGTVYTGFIDSGGTFTYLNAPGATTSVGYTNANDINNAGEVVGTYNTNYNSGNAWHGFTFQNGSYTTIDDPNGTEGTFANGINNSGEIVGDYTDSSGKQHGFIDIGGTFVTIDDPLGTGGTVLTGINDVGQVVGYYQDGSGFYHGFEASLDGGTTSENTPLTITGITLTQADANDALSMSLNVGHGSLALGSSGGLAVTSNGSNGTLSFSGSESAITAALASGVIYTPVAEFQGGDALTVTGTNAEGTGASASDVYALTVKPAAEAPTLAGTTSATVFVSHLVTLGGTDTVIDSDDTLGNVTITGLPNNLSNFNGGAYTSSSGTWTGTAAQFNALSFTAGTTAGTYDLSIAATTTGAEASPATSGYTLTVKPMDVLLSGNQMDSAIQSDLAAYGISSTIVSPSLLQSTDFSQFSGIWLSWSTTYTNTNGQLVSKFANFINSGGNVFAEEAGTNELSFLPNGSSVTTTGGSGDAISIANSFGSLTNNLTGAGLSNWSSSYHDTYGSIGPFTGVTEDSSGRWVTIGESIGQGNLTITGQDPSFHIQYGAGATGAGSPKAQFAVNALSLGPDHTDPPVDSVSDVAFNGASVDLISDEGSPLLELGPNASDNVAFDPSSPDGVLQLDSSATFTGHIALFAPGNTIDLRDIGFGTTSSLAYSGDTSGGTLTVSDGTNTANIALLGQYMASSFATAGDGHGGTLITQAPETAQGQLAQSHA